jgi:hypothetical protein
MDLEGMKAQDGPRWAWARTGALILFVLTGILLLATLNTARSQHPHDPVSAGAQQIDRS